jgi:predicted DNA-binding transcriptional regulator YafY
MSAAARLSRLLALVPWLLAHDGVTLDECAEHFGVSVEQLEVDLWLLVVCGLPGYGPEQLVDIDFWDDGRIHVLDPQTLGRPLRLTGDEATTLLIALRMLAQLPGVDDRAAVLSAAAKLEQAASVVVAGRFVSIDVSVDPAIREDVDVALRDHREITIEYAAATRDEVTHRTIRPRRLFTIDGVSYLEAHCLSADAVRTFRLDRVLSSELGESIADGLDDHEGDAREDAVGRPAGPSRPRRTATLIVEPAARWIIDVHQAVEDPGVLPDGRTRISLPLHSDDWAVRLVLSLRGAAVVTDPPELAAAVAASARAALSAYPNPVQ